MVGRIQVCQVHCLRPVLGDSDQGRMQKRHPALHQKHWEQPQSLAPAGAAAAPGECAGRCVDAAPGCCEDAAAFVKSPDQTQGLTPVGVVGLVQEGSAAQGARAHCHCRMQKRRWRVCGCWDGESYEAPLKATPEMHQGQPWWQPLHRMETAAAAAAAAAAGNVGAAGVDGATHAAGLLASRFLAPAADRRSGVQLCPPMIVAAAGNGTVATCGAGIAGRSGVQGAGAYVGAVGA